MANAGQTDFLRMVRKFKIFLSKDFGRVLTAGFGEPENVREKAEGELVGTGDTRPERLIIQFLRKHFPGDEIYGEETGKAWPPKRRRCWLVDARDGTHNFLMGLPTFGTMIALVESGDVVFAAFYLPFGKQKLFFAGRGRGSWCLGESTLEKLHVSGEKNPKNGILYVEGQSKKTARYEPINRIRTVTRRTRDGISSCWSGTRLASGNHLSATVDALVCLDNKPTDNLPICLLIEEAGGKVTDHLGCPWSIENHASLLFSNGLIHEELLRYMKGGGHD